MRVGSFELLSGKLLCPGCGSRIAETDGVLQCRVCNAVYKPNKYGFIELNPVGVEYPVDLPGVERYTTPERFAQDQIYEKYIKIFLSKEPVETVLDVGCGWGGLVSMLSGEGYNAYGVDIPLMSGLWFRQGNDPARFVCCDAAGFIPFPDDFFDSVLSINVIEHIATRSGACTLVEDYNSIRQQFADEILRVTKPGGRILISCPNKNFPFDVNHSGIDEFSPAGVIINIRNAIYRKTGVNIHPVLGKYHLLSYPEVRKLFRYKKGHSFEPLPVNGFLGFRRLSSGRLRYFTKPAAFYVNSLPKCLRTSFLNPFLLVSIRKACK